MQRHFMIRLIFLVGAMLMALTAHAATLNGGDDSTASSSVGNPQSITATAATGGINQREKLGLSGTMFTNYISCTESGPPYRTFIGQLAYVTSSAAAYTAAGFAFTFDKATGNAGSQSMATNCNTNFSNIKAAGRAYD
jgi:hypothetical protein